MDRGHRQTGCNGKSQYSCQCSGDNIAAIAEKRTDIFGKMNLSDRSQQQPGYENAFYCQYQ